MRVELIACLVEWKKRRQTANVSPAGRSSTDSAGHTVDGHRRLSQSDLRTTPCSQCHGHGRVLYFPHQLLG